MIAASREIMAERDSDDFTDDAIIAACRAGDTDAWMRMVRRYERLVFSVPLHHGLSHAEAQDVVQMTFAALLSQIDALQPGSNLGAWLCTVARRNTWRIFKKTARELQPANDVDWEELARVLGERDAEVFEHWEVAQWLDRGLARLDERCRNLLLALYFGEQTPTYSELAAKLDIALGSVGPTRARCLEKLRNILRED